MAYTIYTLSDPSTNCIRYVGKTGRELRIRLKEHMSPGCLRPHTHKNQWLKKLRELGLKPVIETVETHQCQKQAFDAEQFFIAYFTSLGFKLTNGTMGGEGLVGVKRPPRSEAWRRNLGATHRGKVISPEQREKLRNALKGRPKKPFTAEHRANMAAAARKRWCR